MWIRKGDEMLVWPRSPGSKRLAGFWELPEPERLTQAKLFGELGEFSHSIVNHKYRIILRKAKLQGCAGDLVELVRLD